MGGGTAYKLRMMTWWPRSPAAIMQQFHTVPGRQEMDPDSRAVERTAWLSIAVNIVLTMLNFAVAVFSQSLAVTAEAVHMLVDLVSAMAVMVGVKLARRKSKNFPYGLYKVENMVAVAIALLIFFTGYEIVSSALISPNREVTTNAVLLGGVLMSIALALGFSRYELRVGRETNSPSLIADAQEYRTHVFSSGIVFLALVGQQVGLPLDRWAALLVAMFIAKTGWDLLREGMRVLLDASLDAKTLGKVHRILEREPLLVNVRSLTGRNAGRYRFLEVDVALRTQDLEQAQKASERLEAAIREQVPHVDRVLIHSEPTPRTRIHCAVPLASPDGKVSEHFGEAPYFALVTIRTADGTLEQQAVHRNPYTEVPKAKGIRVAEWLVKNKRDVVLTKESLKGKGPQYVFGNAGVELRQTHARTLQEALAAAAAGKRRPPQFVAKSDLNES